MAKTMQMARKGKIIKLSGGKVKLTSYAWDKLPKSNSLLNLKDQMRLEAEEERLREMKRAFIYD